MKSIKRTLVMSALAMAFSAGSVAYAQQGPASEPQAAAEHQGKMDHAQMMEKMQNRMKERAEKHRAQMHDKLKITPAQESAWKTFTDAMMPAGHMGDMAKHHGDKKEAATLTTPAMIDRHLEKAKEHLAQMQKHADAVKTFYAVLSPEQQKTFDEEHRHMQHRMKHRMQRRMGYHGGHGEHGQGDGWEI